MGVSQVAAGPSAGLALAPAPAANRAARRLAVAVIGGDEVLAARIRAAFTHERMSAHVRWPVAHGSADARLMRPPDVVVLAVPPGHAPRAAVGAVRRRLPHAAIVLALPPGECAGGAADALDAAADGD